MADDERTARERVLDCLLRQPAPLDPGDVSARTGVPRQQVNTRLRELVVRGDVVRIGETRRGAKYAASAALRLRRVWRALITRPWCPGCLDV